MKDQLENPEIKRFLAQFEREGLPAMLDSAFVMVIHEGKPDVKLCLEVGAAVLLDKPLLICVHAGDPVSENLRKCATKIVEIEVTDGVISEASKGRVEDAVYEMTGRLRNRDKGTGNRKGPEHCPTEGRTDGD